jgi:hypothetical protein
VGFGEVAEVEGELVGVVGNVGDEDAVGADLIQVGEVVDPDCFVV